MWVFVKSEAHLWTVGFFDPSGEWHPVSDYTSKLEAERQVHYLNGGKA